MKADIERLIAKLRRVAACIYIAVEESVAKDISETCLAAADELSALPTPPPPEWLRRWLAGEPIGCSTGMAGDEPTYGYDGPDNNGYFAVEVPAAFMARLVESHKAYVQRNHLGGAEPPQDTACANPQPFIDTPLLAAKRQAFDNPTQANLDALIAAAQQASGAGSAPPPVQGKP